MEIVDIYIAFDKMKIWNIYFPYNNYNVILDKLKTIVDKKEKLLVKNKLNAKNRLNSI